MAIGIEAFNRFSQLKKEEKSKIKEKILISPKTSLQEDEVSGVSKFPSTLNVCQHMNFKYHVFNYSTILAIFKESVV